MEVVGRDRMLCIVSGKFLHRPGRTRSVDFCRTGLRDGNVALAGDQCRRHCAGVASDDAGKNTPHG